MTGLILPRRRLLAGLVGLVAAPMVIRPGVLMPVRPLAPPTMRFVVTGTSRFIWSAEDELIGRKSVNMKCLNGEYSFVLAWGDDAQSLQVGDVVEATEGIPGYRRIGTGWI